jgi:hypothetical protein
MRFYLKEILLLEDKIMAKVKMPHPGHDKHLCYLTNIGYHFSNPEYYKAMVKNGKFICRLCGRVAVKQGNLCKPAKL